MQLQPFYFEEGAQLVSELPSVAGVDSYTVDFSHTTGASNRWMQSQISYEDRAAANVLAYTTAPLTSATRVTGSAVVTFQLESSHADAAVYAYLEDVAPDGRVSYVSEGILRLHHRAEQSGAAVRPVTAPGRSYEQAAGSPMTVGVREQVRMVLAPTSVMFAAGHRIRLSVAGHDASVFQRIPAEGTPTLLVHRGGTAASLVKLPIAVP